ncbi:MAG: YfhO family protein, partial [Patescibacteria group bacterium]
LFSLTIATSLGLDGWIREKHSIGKFAHRSLMVIIFFIIVWWMFQSTEHALTASKAILYSAALAGATLIGFFIAITRKKLMIPTLAVLVIIHGVDLFFQFQKFNPFVPSSFIFPQTSIFQFLKERGGIDRFWGYGTASIQANFATQHRLFSPDGYDPLYPKWYGELIHASKDGKLLKNFSTQTRSDATITPGYGELDLPSNLHRLRLFDALGVRYVLDRPENGSTQRTFPSDRFSFIADIDGWRVYENIKAAPRIFLTSSYRVYRTPQEFESIFFSDSFDPSKTILLREPLDKPLGPIENTYVQLSEYQPTNVSLTVASHGNLLYMSDTNYPGWNAYVDGVKTPVLKANYAFRAIYVPEGTHAIRFTFFPASFKIGLIISLVSIMGSLLYILKYERKT